MTNTNPISGVRFGVMALNRIHPEVQDQLLFGAQAKDLHYLAALEEAKAKYTQEAQAAAYELHYVYGTAGWQEFIDDYVENELEQFSDTYRSEENTVEGVFQEVEYRVSWLGGAPILFIMDSPHLTTVQSLCSPCVPNAGDLDSGFEEDGFECYAPPDDWMSPDWLDQLALFPKEAAC